MAKRWYSVSVLSNFEKKIAEQIRHRGGRGPRGRDLGSPGSDRRGDRDPPRQEGDRAERRFMPGYVLVRMDMTDQGYHLINSINRVTGFLGPQGRPMPMRTPR
jgi:transcriptional antiterminator NusG